MIDEIILWTWLIGMVPSVWYLASTLAWGMKYERDTVPEGFDWLMAGLWMLMLIWIWPLAVPIAFCYNNGSIVKGSRFLYVPPRHREELQKAKLKEKEQRIRELERELGIQ